MGGEAANAGAGPLIPVAGRGRVAVGSYCPDEIQDNRFYSQRKISQHFQVMNNVYSNDDFNSQDSGLARRLDMVSAVTACLSESAVDSGAGTGDPAEHRVCQPAR